MTTRTQSTVVAVFRNVADAHSAADALKAAGFDSRDIFISSDTSAAGSYDQPGSSYRTQSHHEGGITGWFKSLFGEENREDQPYYEDAVNSGNTFLSVDVNEQNVEKAAGILNEYSPVDVQRGDTDINARTAATDVPASSTRTPSAKTTPAATTRNTAKTDARNDAGSIPVVREELQVGKRAILRGGVRVYSRLVSEPVQENVNLREEKVRVERTPVNRATTDADLRPGQERVFEVKEYAEEPVVSKQSRVVEEVRVSKEATNRTETVRDNVRHTEVNVENLGSGEARKGEAFRTDDADFRRDFESRYANRGYDYETFGPAYNYGYNMAGDPRYQGRPFDTVEPELREDYARRYPNSKWEQMKDSVRYGWDKLTRKV